MKNYINMFVGSIITGATYFLGGWDTAIQILLVMIVLDYLTGVLKSIFNKKLNSTVGAKGIVKKCGYLIVVAVGVIIDKLIGNTGAIRTVIIYFFVANEGISIIENWGAMGLPIPDVIKNTLEKIKEENGGNK